MRSVRQMTKKHKCCGFQRWFWVQKFRYLFGNNKLFDTCKTVCRPAFLRPAHLSREVKYTWDFSSGLAVQSWQWGDNKNISEGWCASVAFLLVGQVCEERSPGRTHKTKARFDSLSVQSWIVVVEQDPFEKDSAQGLCFPQDYQNSNDSAGVIQ